jgi:putative peptide zinc metalloprotease protein
LGVLLFLVELLWFIVWPLRSEVREWVSRWRVIRSSRRSKFSLMWLLLGLGFFLVPWPGRIDGSAVLRPAEIWPLHAPSGARVETLPFKDGDKVNEGDVLLTMFVPDLEVRKLTLQARLDQQDWQARTSGLSSELSKNFLLNQELLSMLETEKKGLSAEAKQFAPTAPFAGHIRDFSPDLQVGQWVSRKERLAFLVRDDGMWFVETWLDESAVQRVKPGDEAFFVLSSVSGSMVKLKVHSVDEDASRVLSRPELSAQAGGHVLTREKNKQLWLENGMYRVTLLPVEMPADLEGRTWRGDLSIHVAWQVPAWRYIKHGLSVLVREVSF